MSTLNQLRAVASVALQLPSAVFREGCQSAPVVHAWNSRNPVILLHGYAGTDAVWSPVRQALSDAGFGHLVALNYNSFAVDPLQVSAELTRLAREAVEASGAERVHLVGHSLGGVLIRHAIGRQPALAALVGTAVTIASPHRGAPLARIAPGRCARLIHPVGRPEPGSELAARRVRWLAYYSDGDRIVPTTSARIDDAAYRATNILVPGCGHLTICRDARMIRSLVQELTNTETAAAPSALCHAAA